jgi:AraC-like DNA-binding protein
VQTIEHMAASLRHVRFDRTVGPGERGEVLAAGYVVSPFCNYEARSVVRDAYTILYLLHGRGVYAGPDGKRRDILPGVLLQRIPAETHTVLRSRDEDWVEFFLVLPSSLYAALRATWSIDPGRPVLRPGVSELMFTKLQAFMNNLRHGSGVSTAQVIAEAHMLLVMLFEADRELRQGSDEASLIRRAREVLSDSLDRRVDMPAVAAGLGVGYESFRKLFRRLVGVSPKEFRIRQRIDRAKHYLGSGRATVKGVAARLGYPDVASFAKQFRRVAGMAPAAFRDSG